MRPVLYRLSMPDPHTHLYEVEVRVGPVSGPLDMVMPSWTPGSYLMREFPRHVQDFGARDAAGAPVEWRKTDKNTWRVEAGPDGGGAAEAELVVSYRVYANELSVRTSHLDATHGYVNGASVFMYVRGREAEPVALEVRAPADWRIATSLEPAEAGPAAARPERSAPRPPERSQRSPVHRFTARDYDELVDSPLEIGTHRTLAWEEDGVRHEYAIWGRGEVDAERLVADTRAVIGTAKAMFGGTLPYERFVFILHLVPDGRGGLEHRSSCSLQVPAKMLRGPEYEHLIALVAHEFFHVWNGKRIRPEPLGPFDYTREAYTRNLWVVEGFTTYYTDLLLVRAGVMTSERYLERLGESISRLQSLPGRHRQTLEESSFDTWIRFYRPDEHTPSSQISYYHKGALVAMLLDMEIRRATGGSRSLDDVVALLWERYGAPDVGFPEDPAMGIEALAEEVAGVELGPFFERYLRGTGELDYGRALEVVGLEVVDGEPLRAEPARAGETEGPSTDRAPAARSTGPARPPGPARPAGSPPAAQERRLGIRTQQKGDRLVVTHVLAGTPAYEGGVDARDELVAIDGTRATQDALTSRLEAAEDGEEVTFSVLRRDELMTLTLRAGRAAARLRVEAPPSASAEALRERRSWLGEPFDDPTPQLDPALPRG